MNEQATADADLYPDWTPYVTYRWTAIELEAWRARNGEVAVFEHRLWRLVAVKRRGKFDVAFEEA